MGRNELFSFICRDLSGTYVELGTCWGGFAEFLMLHTPLTRLICIDPYKIFPNDIYNDALNLQTQEDLDKKFQIVAQRLYNVTQATQKPSCLLRITSYEAAKHVENNLSFVYIDGNHHHREVLKDLVCWWPKLRKGGILCGDDVEDIKLQHDEGDAYVRHQEGTFGVYGVATALADFAKVAPDFRYTITGNQFYAYK